VRLVPCRARRGQRERSWAVAVGERNVLDPTALRAQEVSVIIGARVEAGRAMAYLHLARPSELD